MFATPKGMSSFLPHYLYALVYWIEENNFDPYLLVMSGAEGVEIPAHVKANDGIIPLNLASRARDPQHYYFTETHFEYKTSFDGQRTIVKVPYSAMYAITARGCMEWNGESVEHLVKIRDGVVEPFYAILASEGAVPQHPGLKSIGEALMGTLTSEVPGEDLAEEFAKRMGLTRSDTPQPIPDVVQPSQSHESHPDVVENTTSAPDPTSNVVYGAFGKRKP